MYRGAADFRPQYKKIANLRSMLRDTPLLALSATVTMAIVDDVLHSLQLARADVVIKSNVPDQPNVYVELINNSSEPVDVSLDWLVSGVEEAQVDFPKTVIFTRTIKCVSEIFTALMHRLGAKAYVSGIKDSKHRLVSMFHAHVSPALQTNTLAQFAKPTSVIRVLVSTIALAWASKYLTLAG